MVQCRKNLRVSFYIVKFYPGRISVLCSLSIVFRFFDNSGNNPLLSMFEGNITTFLWFHYLSVSKLITHDDISNNFQSIQCMNSARTI